MTDRNKIPPFFPDTLRRLNYLIDQLQLTSYLEIGLGNGGTYDNIKASRKVGVDPHPWNPAARDLEGVETLTSDAYFTRNWDSGQTFDLILLDGLHTAEQTYRDFVNSLHFAHSTTIWMVDDVMPNDVFSAIPDQTEAMRLRKTTIGGDNNAWHGNVYKVVWMIKAFHNNMKLRSFAAGQPQALVYFCADNKAPISKATLNEVGNLSYVDTLVRREDYGLSDEHELLKECAVTTKKRMASLHKGIA